MADSTPAAAVQPRRRRRRWLKVIGVALLLLIVLVALLPTLVSMGLGRGAIRGVIADNINGSVELTGVRPSWFGSQKVEGLRIVDAAGREAVNISASLDNSLVSLAMGRARPMRITLSGSVAGEVREDGSISLADLVKQRPQTPSMPKPPPDRPTPRARDAIPPIVLTVQDLDLRLDDLQRDQKVSVDGLAGTISYADPAQPITIDLHGKSRVDSGGRSESGEIDIAGKADGLFASDGSITLRGASATLDVKAGGVPLPLALQGQPTTLQNLTLHVASDDLTERISLNAVAMTRIGDAAKSSAIRAEGVVGKILDGSGKLSLRAATAHLNIEASNIPIASPEIKGEMSRLEATVVSDDLTRRIEVAVEGSGTVNDTQPSTINANIALADPFAPNGAFMFDIAKLTGSASGRNVPTSLAQPALAAGGLDAQRDLGPTVDLDAFFPGGIGGDLMLEANAPKAQAEITAKINADQSISGSKLVLNVPAAHPDLIAGLSKGGLVSDRPLNVNVNLTSFHVPPIDETTDSRPLAQVAGTGTITIDGPALVRSGAAAVTSEVDAAATQPQQAPPALPLDQLRFDFETPGLSQHVNLKADGALGGGRIAIDERITSLIDPRGAIALAGAKPQGTAKIDDLPIDTILAFAPPAQHDLIRQVVGRSLSADVATSPSEKGLRADIAARSERVTAEIDLIARDDRSLRLERTVVDATLTPRLAEILQAGSANPVVLGSSAKTHVELQPLVLALSPGADVLANPVSARITLADAMLEKTPGLAQPLAIDSFSADATLARAGEIVTATIVGGTATLKRGENGAEHDLARMTIDGTIAVKPDGVDPNLDVRLDDLHTGQAEALLGIKAGAISDWTGEGGSLDVHVETVKGGYSARATSAMSNLQGTFKASMRDDLISLTADTSKLVLARQTLQARLNRPPAAEPSAQPPAAESMIVVDDDVPLQAAIRRCELPRQMLIGEPFDAAKVNIDIGLSGGPLKTSTVQGVRSTLSDLDISLRAADISTGLQFALQGTAEAIVPEEPAKDSTPDQQPAAAARDERAQPPDDDLTPEQRREARREQRQRDRATTRPDAAPPAETSPPPQPEPPVTATSQPQPGTLDVTGTLADLVNGEGKLDLAHGRLQMHAKAENVPTAVADMLGDMQGLLVAAVGPQMNATFIADDFSANSGTLDAKLTTTNGSLEGLLRGREQSFRINRNNPIKAELDITPPLRERLLMKIHPILADIRTTEQPLRIEIPTALAAIPADVSKLRAEINISVGKVDLDSGSTTLKILSLFGRGDRLTIPGEIEPIVAKIHNGVVTYDKFAVHIDRYTLNYSGQIDLVKQEVNLRTEIPLKALGEQIEQLAGYADAISVPLVTRGKFGALKTSIDPDFDLGKAALEAGFKGGLGDLLGGEGGNLIDQILNKDKDRQPDALDDGASSDRPRRRERPTTQPQ